MIIDPKQFGLSSKTVIEQVSKNNFAIIISRKSRVIMADGKKLLAKAEAIKDLKSNAKVSLKISAPLCSKTKKFLEDHGISIEIM
jgi:hypothetical protein